MDKQAIEIFEKLIEAVKISNFEITTQIITIVILLLTGSVIFWYTLETKRTRLLSARPVLKIVNTRSNGSLNIKNIGKGPALNIELRISQVHRNGGRTNLRNLLELEQQRHFVNLGEGEGINTKGEGVVQKYIEAKGSDFAHGVRGVFIIVALYQDIYNEKYYTLTLFKIVGPDYILKKTFVGEYGRNSLPKIKNLDWIS